MWMVVAVLPSLLLTLSPLDPPPKPSKYSKYLTLPSTSYATYAASASPHIPSYRTYSYYNRKSELPSKDMLSTSQLMPSPSIVSAASVPFVFGRKGKDKKPSIVRAKPAYSKPSATSQSQDSIDWSSDDMQQHPIDEAPRKVSSRLPPPSCIQPSS